MVGLYHGVMNKELDLAVLSIANLLFATAGFAISGYRRAGGMWMHLVAVALGVWIAGLINVVTNIATINQWLTSIIAIVVFAALGGGIALAIKKFRGSRTPQV